MATLVLAPGFWAILAGTVALASGEASVGGGDGRAAAAVAFGLALLPFVFLVLAFASQHPRAPGAVLKAMGLAVLVGLPVSALAADAVTGLVAGIGAGGCAALRADAGHTVRRRAVAVALAALYAFVLVRLGSALVLLPAPVFPFTAVGLADALADRRSAGEPAD